MRRMCRIRQFLQNRKGMTLVELLVTIVAIGLIITAASVLIVTANSNFRAASVRADLSIRARAAVETIASRVRDASIVEQLLSGNWSATVFRDSESFGYVFSLVDGELLMSFGGNTVSVTDDVSVFSIVPFQSGATFAYRISITLRSGSVKRGSSTLVSLRR